MTSINWEQLKHAYGNASDIPELLHEAGKYRACEGYEDEPFYSLWSSLCHQGDIYTASYAAVPLLVALIENAPKPTDYNYFLLPISIHIAHLKNRGPQIPDGLIYE